MDEIWFVTWTRLDRFNRPIRMRRTFPSQEDAVEFQELLIEQEHYDAEVDSYWSVVL